MLIDICGEFVTKKVAGTKFLCGFLRSGEVKMRLYKHNLFSEGLGRLRITQEAGNLELGHTVYSTSRCSVRLETASIKNIFAY